MGRRDDFTYDANGRTLTEKWYDASGTFLQTKTFTYDANGNNLTAQAPAGSYTFTYDSLNRVATAAEPFSLTLTFAYDANSNRTVVQDSKGGLQTTTYDADDLDDMPRLYLVLAETLVAVQQADPAHRSIAFTDAKKKSDEALASYLPKEASDDLTRTYRRWTTRIAKDAGSLSAWAWGLWKKFRPSV